MRGQQLLVLVNAGAFMFEIVGDRAAQAFVCEVVQAVGFDWQVAACQFVLTLGSCFHDFEFSRNGKIHGLVIAGFEMQEGVVFGRTPVAAVECFRANEVQRTCDNLAVTSR